MYAIKSCVIRYVYKTNIESTKHEMINYKQRKNVKTSNLTFQINNKK